MNDGDWNVCTWDGSYSGCVAYDRDANSFAFTGVDALPVGTSRSWSCCSRRCGDDC